MAGRGREITVFRCLKWYRLEEELSLFCLSCKGRDPLCRHYKDQQREEHSNIRLPRNGMDGFVRVDLKELDSPSYLEMCLE